MEIDSGFPLMEAPVASTSYAKHTRQAVPLENTEKLSKNYLVTKESGKDYTKQYANLYYMRLAKLRQRVLKQAAFKWDELESGGQKVKPKYVGRVLDVQQGELCYIVGTVYMNMRLKPDVLQEIAREHNIIVPPPAEKIYSAGDEISLEDESGRVNLVGDRIESKTWNFVTGIICAVLGAETPSGEFEVMDVCWAGLPQQSSAVPNGKGKAADTESAEGTWVALVSGMELGGTEDADDLKADLLSEYLTGELAGDSEQVQASKISRLILAGNSMRQPVRGVEKSSTTKKPKQYGYDASIYSSRPTQALNIFLTSILPNMDVTLMPGERDPAVPTLPQQPMHSALLPDACKFPVDQFTCVSNPFSCQIAGKLFLGTSGQNIDDIYRYMDDDDRLKMVKDTLNWSHLAPTAPDTIACYPISKNDPFIITETPHVYFVGNQPAFQTELITGDDGQKVRVICVPVFSETGQVVLVNTESLEAKVITFAVPE